MSTTTHHKCQLKLNLKLKKTHKLFVISKFSFEIILKVFIFKNYVIDEAFEAPDKDDPATPNSQVLYEILSIEPGLLNF